MQPRRTHHAVAAAYCRNAHRLEAPDVLLNALDAPRPGLASLGFAFLNSTGYQKYQKNKSCASRSAVYETTT